MIRAAGRRMNGVPRPVIRFIDLGTSRSWRAVVVRYGFTALLVLAALYIRLELAPTDEGLQYVTFFPAVALASMMAGFGPGLFATALGAAIANLTFATPLWSLLVFLFDGLIVSAAAEIMRRYVRGYQVAVADLEKANRAKSEFLAGMSHELRTPLNAVIGFSEFGKARALESVYDKSAEYFEDIHGAGQHLLHLVDDLLDISLIESGKAVLDEQAFDLADVLEFATSAMGLEAAKARLSLEVAIPNSIRVRADNRRIRQVLLNLLANAVDFTPEGGRVSMSAGRNLAGEAFVSVRDTGVGMDAETLAKISQPFGGVGRAKRNKDGSGLGLTVSRFLIELHGGRLELASQAGEGTVATIFLPRQRVLEPEADDGGVFPGLNRATEAPDGDLGGSPPGSARSTDWLAVAGPTAACPRRLREPMNA